MFSCPAWINYASILTSPIQTEAFIRSKTPGNLYSKDSSKMESFQAIEKINSTSNLSAKHFEDGTINLNNVMEEVNYLKQQVSDVRPCFSCIPSVLTFEDNEHKAGDCWLLNGSCVYCARC